MAKSRWGAVAYKLRLRPISSSKASVPGGLSVSVPEAGPRSKYHGAWNTLGETSSKSVSQLLTFFQSTKEIELSILKKTHYSKVFIWLFFFNNSSMMIRTLSLTFLFALSQGSILGKAFHVYSPSSKENTLWIVKATPKPKASSWRLLKR